MYLIVIAWLYVTVMMAVAEAASPQGSWLGAAITLVLYGLLPLGLLVYILDTPQRKRRLRARAAAAEQGTRDPHCEPTEDAPADPAAAPSAAPDAGGHAPAAAQHPGVAPVREKL